MKQYQTAECRRALYLYTQAAKDCWNSVRFLFPSEHGIDFEFEPSTSGKTISRCAECASETILKNPYIDPEQTSFVLDPDNSSGFNEALSIHLINSGAQVVVSERDEDGLFMGYRCLDSEYDIEREETMENDTDYELDADWRDEEER